MVLFIQWLQICLYKRFEALIFQFFWPFIVCKNHQNLLKQSYYSVNWLWRCHQFEFGSCFPPYFPPNHNGVKTFFEVAFEFSLKLNSQDSLKILFFWIFFRAMRKIFICNWMLSMTHSTKFHQKFQSKTNFFLGFCILKKEA